VDAEAEASVAAVEVVVSAAAGVEEASAAAVGCRAAAGDFLEAQESAAPDRPSGPHSAAERAGVRRRFRAALRVVSVDPE
jgi:hypothetical protein